MCQHCHRDDDRLLARNTRHPDGAGDPGLLGLAEVAGLQSLAKAGPFRAAADEADEGEVAALTLAPATWSRNRFFELYKDPQIREVRRRAGLLRGMVRHLAREKVDDLRERREGETFVIAYRVADLGLTRTVTLSRFENAVLQVTLSRARGEAPTDPWKSEVDRALAHLEPQTS